MVGLYRPCQIPASHVYVEWLSDSDVKDWGWKMTITAKHGDVDAVVIPPATLEQRLGRVYELLHEQVRAVVKSVHPVVFFMCSEMRPGQDLGVGVL